MVIAGLGTAAPPRRYTQQECWEAAQHARQFHNLEPRSRAILRKVLTGRNGIHTRHLALETLADAFDLDPDVLQSRFLSNAPLLATQAAEKALDQAKVSASQIDALLISTCTGYLCPGLTSYVGERLRLRPDVLTLDFVGQGCGAALPNLRSAEALLHAGRCSRVLSVCVEVCSAAFYLDDDPGVLISACLFGDGAGAAVLANDSNGNRRLQCKSAFSLLEPGERDLLRFQQHKGMLRNILSPEVPRLAGEHVKRLLDQALENLGLRQEEILTWIVHPGGRDILLAVQQQLKLKEIDLRWSAAVLEEFGNLSSPSVFFVLERALAGNAPGGYWWMTSFGAGFSVHGALWEVE
jgi:alkylresorcinol/alkylpyrone synthase